jgi:hypothetical protein
MPQKPDKNEKSAAVVFQNFLSILGRRYRFIIVIKTNENKVIKNPRAIPNSPPCNGFSPNR